ncbi:MAG: hypothetical protein ABEH43_03980, partial [Flavobacteriales bacterium]
MKRSALLFTGLLTFSIISNKISAQIQPFNTGGNTTNYFGQTSAQGNNMRNWIRSVGVGNFENDNDFTNSFLHINSNHLLLPANGSISDMGEVFRTDVPGTAAPRWRMLKGGTETSMLFSPANNNNFFLQATNGDMAFNTGGSNERMRILGNNGFTGIGTESPLSKLHVSQLDSTLSSEIFRTTGNYDRTIQWGMYARQFRQIGPVGRPVQLARFFVKQDAPSGKINFDRDQALQIDATLSDLILNSQGEESFRIDDSTGFMSMSIDPQWPIANPQSLLHLGTKTSGDFGQRDWMNIGTFYNNASDNMYVGLRQIGGHNDSNEAIINWGNNPTNSRNGDRLRFVFTSDVSGSNINAKSEEGLEIARMITDSGHAGKTGFGDFLTPDLNPQNRVDVMGNMVIGSNYAGNEPAPENSLLVEDTIGTNTTNPTERLDVDGNGRFRTLPDDVDTTLNKVVVVDDSGNLNVDTTNFGEGG